MTLNGLMPKLCSISSSCLGLAKPLGWYMAQVYEGRSCGLDRIFSPIERLIYRICEIGPSRRHGLGRHTAIAMLLFNAAGLLFLYGSAAGTRPPSSEPRRSRVVGPDLAFNTAASFASNTNWQSYGGETTLSYLTQMIGLTVQNFVSAATGMAILVALITGIGSTECADASETSGPI